ncbi:unnamed protein product [Peronospora destructor]|uniref:Uncharacterized protein n=1 Tax=Peronospora destructor TaxID=86335 RepID=A0AAV0U0P1_9STRA|nr:unnamed protein product [Peronospora destructor]
MHNSSDREQLYTGLQPDSADRGSELYRQRRLKRSHHLMSSQDDGFSSPCGEQQQQYYANTSPASAPTPAPPNATGSCIPYAIFTGIARTSISVKAIASIAWSVLLGASSSAVLASAAIDASDAFRNAQHAAGGVPNSLGGGPSPPPAAMTRLPPISFLIPRKLDGYCATSTPIPNLPPTNFITYSLNGNAGKTA